jgi:hypothetical protein
MKNNVMDLTPKLNLEYDIILKATFYLDTRWLYNDMMVFYKDDFYKVVDWSYSLIGNEVMANVELTLDKISVIKIQW